LDRAQRRRAAGSQAAAASFWQAPSSGEDSQNHALIFCVPWTWIP
jgi:hypothetical protein